MQAIRFEIQPHQTYLNEETAIRAVENILNKIQSNNRESLRYFLTWTKEGRCFPIFIGENAVQAGLHFKFNVVG